MMDFGGAGKLNATPAARKVAPVIEQKIFACHAAQDHALALIGRAWLEGEGDNVDEVDRLRKQQVERARYEAELAQRRYMRVDPDNRLVADTLEADWNRKLRVLQEAQQEYEQQRDHDRVAIDGDAKGGTQFVQLLPGPRDTWTTIKAGCFAPMMAEQVGGAPRQIHG